MKPATRTETQREARRRFGTRLDFDVPVRAFPGQPMIQRMIVVFIVAEDRDQSQEVLRRDTRQQLLSGGAIVDFCIQQDHPSIKELSFFPLLSSDFHQINET